MGSVGVPVSKRSVRPWPDTTAVCGESAGRIRLTLNPRRSVKKASVAARSRHGSTTCAMRTCSARVAPAAPFVVRYSIAGDCPGDPGEARDRRHLGDITLAAEFRHIRRVSSIQIVCQLSANNSRTEHD
jgi:hypothetical protein